MLEPKPKCRFGRDHVWSSFVYIEGRYCCQVCGIEDDESWWTGEDGRTYIGPSEPVYADMSVSGWLLRQPDEDDHGPGCDGPYNCTCVEVGRDA